MSWAQLHTPSSFGKLHLDDLLAGRGCVLCNIKRMYPQHPKFRLTDVTDAATYLMNAVLAAEIVLQRLRYKSRLPRTAIPSRRMLKIGEFSVEACRELAAKLCLWPVEDRMQTQSDEWDWESSCMRNTYNLQEALLQQVPTCTRSQGE